MALIKYYPDFQTVMSTLDSSPNQSIGKTKKIKHGLKTFKYQILSNKVGMPFGGIGKISAFKPN